MEIKTQIIQTKESFTDFCELLKLSKLPYKDLRLDEHLLVGYYNGSSLIGTGALEMYEDYGLIRSIAVHSPHQGKSLGVTITKSLIQRARKKNLKAVYLLTETAQEYFSKRGFTTISRDAVPAAVTRASQFSYACPETAIVMFLRIE